MGRLLVNIDISTAVMWVMPNTYNILLKTIGATRYNGGPLVDLLMAFLGVIDTRNLSPRHLGQSQARLNSFLKGLAVWSRVPQYPGRPPRYRKILRVVMTAPDDFMFTNDQTGKRMSISVSFLSSVYQTRTRQGLFRHTITKPISIGYNSIRLSVLMWAETSCFPSRSSWYVEVFIHHELLKDCCVYRSRKARCSGKPCHLH